VLFLNAINPDALIVRANLARTDSAQPFDVVYASTLSADALPVLLEALPTLAPQHRTILEKRLLERWSSPPVADWRTWNWSRAQAWESLSAAYPTVAGARSKAQGS
jgi:hypothetical protein